MFDFFNMSQKRKAESTVTKASDLEQGHKKKQLNQKSAKNDFQEVIPIPKEGWSICCNLYHYRLKPGNKGYNFELMDKNQTTSVGTLSPTEKLHVGEGCWRTYGDGVKQTILIWQPAKSGYLSDDFDAFFTNKYAKAKEPMLYKKLFFDSNHQKNYRSAYLFVGNTKNKPELETFYPTLKTNPELSITIQYTGTRVFKQKDKRWCHCLAYEVLEITAKLPEGDGTFSFEPVEEIDKAEEPIGLEMADRTNDDVAE